MGFSSSPSLTPSSVQQALLPASPSVVQGNRETHLISEVSGDHRVIARNEPRIRIFSSQGSSAVWGSSSFNHSCAEGKRIESVFFLTGRTFLFCFYLKTDWKELVSNSCQKSQLLTCAKHITFQPQRQIFWKAHIPYSLLPNCR